MAFTRATSPPRRTPGTRRINRTGLYLRVLRVLRVLCGDALSSHNLCKRVTQPIEQPVGGQELDDRVRAEREQPLPVTDRALEEQNLLVRHRQMGEQVHVEQ